MKPMQWHQCEQFLNCLCNKVIWQLLFHRYAVLDPLMCWPISQWKVDDEGVESGLEKWNVTHCCPMDLHSSFRIACSIVQIKPQWVDFNAANLRQSYLHGMYLVLVYSRCDSRRRRRHRHHHHHLFMFLSDWVIV